MKKLFTVYDRYIFTQVLMTTFVSILLFTIVWIAPEMLLNTIKGILEGLYTPKTGVMILIYELPKIFGKAFPVGLLLGSLFTFDKLSKDSELTIFRAVGMSFQRILAPVLVLSMMVTALCFITYDKWIPYSCQKLKEIKGGGTLTQYIYTQKDENNHPMQAVIVSMFCDHKMYDVIVMNFSDRVFNDLHGVENILVAENGEKGKTPDGKSCWILENVTSYDINEDGIFHQIDKKDRVKIESELYPDSGRVILPLSRKEMIGKDYQQINQQLVDAGFTNIVLCPNPDIEDGFNPLKKKDGEIQSVTINGTSEFKKNLSYDNDVLIRIIYHTYVEKEEVETQILGENEIKLTFSSKDLKGKNHDDVSKQLRDAGFINITEEKIEDIKKDSKFGFFSKEDGEVEKVSIDGNDSFKKVAIFNKNSKVVITYHTYEN